LRPRADGDPADDGDGRADDQQEQDDEHGVRLNGPGRRR
jgi:hypothetical protein